MNNLVRYILLPAILLTCFVGYAQTGDSNILGTQSEQEVYNTRDEEKLPRSRKPRQEAPASNLTLDMEGLDYDQKIIQVPTDFNPSPMKAKLPDKVKMSKLYNNYIKLGFGRFMTPFGSLYLNNDRNSKVDYGLEFNHYSPLKTESSGWSPWEKYARFREDDGHLKLNFTPDKHTISLEAGAYNTSYFYYADTLADSIAVYEGASPEDSLPMIDKDTLRNNFTKIHFDLGIEKNFNTDEIFYAIKVKFKDYLDRQKNNELHLSVLPSLDWYISEKFSADLDAHFTFTNAKFNAVNQSRIFFDFTPKAHFSMSKLRAWAGIRVSTFSDSTNQFGLYPIAGAEYDVLNKAFTVGVGVHGKMINNTIYDRISENRYIDLSQVRITPTKEKFNIYGLVKGSFAKYFSYSAKGYARIVKDELIYLGRADGSKFEMLYDSTFREIGGELAFQVNWKDKIKAGVEGKFRNFKTSLPHNYYHEAPIRVDVWASYNFANKLFATAEVYVFGPRSAIALRESTPGVFVAEAENAVADVNIDLEYRFSKRISIFLELNNILNIQWDRWNNYQEKPFDVKGGFTLSF